MDRISIVADSPDAKRDDETSYFISPIFRELDRFPVRTRPPSLSVLDSQRRNGHKGRRSEDSSRRSLYVVAKHPAAERTDRLLGHCRPRGRVWAPDWLPLYAQVALRGRRDAAG